MIWDLVARPGLEHAAEVHVVAREENSRKEVEGCTEEGGKKTVGS